MTVLDRMCLFCVHDETSHFVFVGEDSTEHIKQAVKRNNCKYHINNNNEKNSNYVNNDNNANNYNNKLNMLNKLNKLNKLNNRRGCPLS